ncbi:MAG: hypothetical protein VXX89_02565 [Pseudomonadota bacterium]|nr:hypothetical protein [Pseudomonadota bacterium]
MLIRSLVYGLLITLLSSCLQTAIEQPTYDLKQLNDATPWKVRGKMLVSTDSERQTLKFTWMHLSEDQDRIELRDAFGLQSVILVKELNEYYRENEKGQRVPLSANTLEEPLARLLSGLPSDIARLLIGRSSSDNRVISEVVTWSNSTQSATPKVLRVLFGQYSLKIMVDQWDIGGSE